MGMDKKEILRRFEQKTEREYMTIYIFFIGAVILLFSLSGILADYLYRFLMKQI